MPPVDSGRWIHGKASLVRLLATICGSTSTIGGATVDVRFDPSRAIWVNLATKSGQGELKKMSNFEMFNFEKQRRFSDAECY